MIKVVFTYDVAMEKQQQYFADTAEIIKPFWEEHGCSSYSVWQIDDGSPVFVKEMLLTNSSNRNLLLLYRKWENENFFFGIPSPCLLLR